MDFETAYNEWLAPIEARSNFSRMAGDKSFNELWNLLTELAKKAKVTLTAQDIELFQAGGGVSQQAYGQLHKKLPTETAQLYASCKTIVDAKFYKLIDLEVENRVELYQYCHTVPLAEFVGNEMITVRCDEIITNKYKDQYLHLVKHLRNLGFTVEVQRLYCSDWSKFGLHKRLITANVINPRKLLMCYPSHYPIEFTSYPDETYWYTKETKEAELIKLYYCDETVFNSSWDGYFASNYVPEHEQWKEGWRIVKSNE